MKHPSTILCPAKLLALLLLLTSTSDAQIFNGGTGSGSGIGIHQQFSGPLATHFAGGSANGTNFGSHSQFSSAPVSHFSGGSNGGSSVVNSGISSLPVELLSFTATIYNINNVILKWQTVSEINNEHFMVEKSQNGTAFLSIQKVPGQGNSNEKHDYEFIDTTPFLTNYYRLKQIDFDGSFAYSPTVNLSVPILHEAIKIYPNPSIGVFNIVLSINNDHIKTFIHDLNGLLIKTYPASSRRSFEIDISSFPAGVYIVTVHTNSSIFSTPLVVTEN